MTSTWIGPAIIAAVISGLITALGWWASQALAQLADDLRTERFERLEAARKVEIWNDYVALGVYALELAEAAIGAIQHSLDEEN